MSSITIPWPDGGPLSETQWRKRMEDLADRAAAMIGRLDVPLQDQATLATQFFGVAWSAVSPEVVYASAHASLAVGQNLLVSQTPAAQLVEISERLEAVWLAAQSDPTAGIASVGPLLLERGPWPDHVPQTRRRKPKPVAEALEPAAPAPAADADDLPLACSEAEPPAAVPADLELEPGVEELELELQPVAAEPPESPAAVPEPLPALGAAAAFGFGRQVRNRINAGKGVSSTASTV